MKKAVMEIMKKLKQTAAGKKMTPKQLEDRAKLDYKDSTQYKANEARGRAKSINTSQKMLEAGRNPKNPKNKALLRDREAEIAKYEKMSDNSSLKGGKVGYKKGGSVKCKRDGICVRGKTKGRMV